MHSADSQRTDGDNRQHRSSIVRTMADLWTTAAFLRDKMQDDARSAALRWAVESLQEAMEEDADAVLTVSEAAEISGASLGAVRRALASGALENVGERYRPRIRRGDLQAWSPPRGRQGPQSPDAADASSDWSPQES